MNDSEYGSWCVEGMEEPYVCYTVNYPAALRISDADHELWASFATFLFLFRLSFSWSFGSLDRDLPETFLPSTAEVAWARACVLCAESRESVYHIPRGQAAFPWLDFSAQSLPLPAFHFRRRHYALFPLTIRDSRVSTRFFAAFACSVHDRVLRV